MPVAVISGTNSTGTQLEDEQYDLHTNSTPLGNEGALYKETQTAVAHIPTTSVTAVNIPTSCVTASTSVVLNKSSKKSEIDKKTEDPKELTKKIYKALAEKILKNKTQQKAKTSTETPTTSVTSNASSQCTNGMIHTLTDLEGKLTIDLTSVTSGDQSADPSQTAPVTTMSHCLQTSLPVSTVPVISDALTFNSMNMSVQTTQEQCFAGYPDIRPIDFRQTIPAINLNQNSQHVQNTHQPPVQQMQQQQQQTPLRQNSLPVTSCNSMSYTNSTNNYMYPPVTPPQNGHMTSEESSIMLERYIQQQQQFYQEQQQQQQQTMYPYPVAIKENYAMKSPDSGFHEPCLSPPDANQVVRNFWLNLHTKHKK